MTIYGQTLGVFKRKNNECIRNREKTNLHKIKKLCSFFDFAYVMLWHVLRHELRHYDVIVTYSWRSTRYSNTCEIKITTFLILCRSVFSPLQIHSLFLRLNTPNVWPYMVMWREIWISLITCNSTPFYLIDMGFSL